MDKKLQKILDTAKEQEYQVTVLTGAGVSAESGIPTFRGQDGYWTKGSKVYQPEELATWRFFQEQPYEMWKWYLARKKGCDEAQPNEGHIAIAEMEQMLQDRFLLITQNIDSLHLRAGNSLARTYQIHGTLAYMRCSRECSTKIYPVPEELVQLDEKTPLTEEQKKLLVCPICGAISRPHVLLFDECYNDEFYYYDRSIYRIHQTDLLIVIGTSGATTLANLLGQFACRKQCAFIDINPENNPFRSMACSVKNGCYIAQPSSKVLKEIADYWKK